MGQLLRTKRHTATGKQSQVLVAAVNRHMPATPALGQPTAIKDANEVTILMRQLTPLHQEHGQSAQASTRDDCVEELHRRRLPTAALRRPPKSIAMPRSTPWRSAHP
jgi:anti-sigma factor ChrR (cupin superfamily)